jgi:hypothetical protein
VCGGEGRDERQEKDKRVEEHGWFKGQLDSGDDGDVTADGWMDGQYIYLYTHASSVQYLPDRQ